jgi:DNA repair exonuclease SbcCD ATPase subunit
MAITKVAAILLVVGLIAGVAVGYGVGYMTTQSQMSQMQSDLSKAQADLSKAQSDLSDSQSEVSSLRSDLTGAQSTISSLEADLTEAQSSKASLETQLSQLQTEHTTLSAEYDTFKSDLNSLMDSLKKKMALEEAIIEMWILFERLDQQSFIDALLGLGPYVNAVGDAELSTYWNDLQSNWDEGNLTEVDANLADLMERNSALIQNDLNQLDALLGT